MPLERQVIEKKDFPIGRRGYDPDAVDSHLAALADEVDALKASSRTRTETLAATASAQVQAIVEAAETSAAAITRQAEDDAADIRAEASEEASAARQQASSQARDYVGKVSESTSVMLQRLDAMEAEMSALLEALRTGSNRLGADLQLLEGNLDDVKTAVAPRPRFEPEPAPPVKPSPARRAPVRAAPPAVAAPPVSPGPIPAVSEPLVSDVEEFGDDFEYEEEEILAEAAPVAVAPVAGADEDIEGARLVALNMALNGTAREETDRYLAENFALGDRGRLLDEVYASVEG